MPQEDPMLMRSGAEQLRIRADRLRAYASEVATHIDSMTFAGPAADRFRTQTTERLIRLRAAAARLDEGASALVRSAAQIELQQMNINRS